MTGGDGRGGGRRPSHAGRPSRDIPPASGSDKLDEDVRNRARVAGGGGSGASPRATGE